MLVSLWINSDNKLGGYWNTLEVSTMSDAKSIVELHPDNWSIHPDNDGSTWMIAIVEGKRIGAIELWNEYDDTTCPSRIADAQTSNVAPIDTVSRTIRLSDVARIREVCRSAGIRLAIQVDVETAELIVLAQDATLFVRLLDNELSR